MGGKRKPDASGWATKYGVVCSDGLTLAPGTFAGNDGGKVPVVYQHNHDSIHNVLGHALIRDRPEGVRADIYFDETPEGASARTQVRSGTLNSLSVFARKVQKDGRTVVHADLAEVSLVLKGANPEAVIDEFYLQHADGELEDTESFTAAFGETLSHADGDGDSNEDDGEDSDKDAPTVAEIYSDMSDLQKEAVTEIVRAALEKAGDGDNDNDKKGDEVSHHNVFEKGTDLKADIDLDGARAAIAHDMRTMGSFKAAYLAHAETYGLSNPEMLFPEAQTTGEITELRRDQGWVTQLLNGTTKLPYGRFRSRYANLTGEELRARGYVTGSRKLDTVYATNRRETGPTTIYVKTSLDRDTEIDLSNVQNFDVWQWMWKQLRIDMNEELARAMLLGDGRPAMSPDKIDETAVRPIVSDDDWYTRKYKLSDASLKLNDSSVVKEISYIMQAYLGKGLPYFFGSAQAIARMLWIEDKQGHPLYASKTELADKMGIAGFVSVPLLANAHVTLEGGIRRVFGVLVNPSDYCVGSNNGGQLTSFENFDLEVNKRRALLETRISGALRDPGTAILLTGTPEPLTGVMVPDPKKASDPQLPILR